jgi:hypothetical protein
VPPGSVGQKTLQPRGYLLTWYVKFTQYMHYFDSDNLCRAQSTSTPTDLHNLSTAPPSGSSFTVADPVPRGGHTPPTARRSTPMSICLHTPPMSLLLGHANTVGAEVDAAQTQTRRRRRRWESVAHRARAEGPIERVPQPGDLFQADVGHFGSKPSVSTQIAALRGLLLKLPDDAIADASKHFRDAARVCR